MQETIFLIESHMSVVAQINLDIWKWEDIDSIHTIAITSKNEDQGCQTFSNESAVKTA